MMGRQTAGESLFYEFRLEDYVPADHSLRRIDVLLDLSELRADLRDLYSHTGRPSVDPELMIRMLIVGYLYGIRSETRLCQEVHLNLAYRWFCKLGLEGRVPERSTFSKNRHGRFAEGNVLRRVFELVVTRCIEAGIVGGVGALVDGSTVEADANRDKRDSPDKIADAWDKKERVTRPVQAYLDDLDAAGAPQPNSGGKTPKGPKYISETDPQAAWSLKDGPGRFSYETNYLVDDLNGVIVDVEATPARLSQEIVAAKAMLERSKGYGFTPKSLAADKSYGTSPFLAWLEDREIIQYIPVLDRTKQTDGKLTREAFRHDAERDVFICPQGHDLKLRADIPERRLKRYQGNKRVCGECPIKASCTDAPSRSLAVSTDEPLREKVRAIAETEAYQDARRRRKKVEMLFAHLKRHLGIKRLRLRGLSGAKEEFLLAATAQNLKRLAKLAPA
ncbi:MAG: IS1182 family transposase [Pseudomonadota bacterium]